MIDHAHNLHCLRDSLYNELWSVLVYNPALNNIFHIPNAVGNIIHQFDDKVKELYDAT